MEVSSSMFYKFRWTGYFKKRPSTFSDIEYYIAIIDKMIMKKVIQNSFLSLNFLR